MNGSNEKFTEQYRVKQIILTGIKHNEFWKIVLKFDLSVYGKFAFLLTLKSWH